MIDFVYYSEGGVRGENAPIRFGEGLTSQVLQTREPLLLNREAQFAGRSDRRDPGQLVPRRPDPRRRRGDRRHQRPGHDPERAVRRGRFAPARHARGQRRRGDPERAALSRRAAAGGRDDRPGRGRRRDLRDARPRPPSWSASPIAPWPCSPADTSAVFLAEDDGAIFRPFVALGLVRRRGHGRHDHAAAKGSSATWPRRGEAEMVNDVASDGRTVDDRRDRGRRHRVPADGRAASLARRGHRDDGDLAVGAGVRRSPRRTCRSSSASPSRPRSRSRTPACSRRAARPRRRPSRPTRPSPRSWPR